MPVPQPAEMPAGPVRAVGRTARSVCTVPRENKRHFLAVERRLCLIAAGYRKHSGNGDLDTCQHKEQRAGATDGAH